MSKELMTPSENWAKFKEMTMHEVDNPIQIEELVCWRSELMKKTTITSQWLDFRDKMLPKKIPNNVVRIVRDAFYAGNMSMFWALMDINSMEDVEIAEQRLKDLERELHNWKIEMHKDKVKH